jgi:hypothetical protein
MECTVCKTKAQLALKRCKHFELGYVLMPFLRLHSQLERGADCVALTVVIRKPRVPLLSSKPIISVLANSEPEYYPPCFVLFYSVLLLFPFVHPRWAKMWHRRRERHMGIKDTTLLGK